LKNDRTVLVVDDEVFVRESLVDLLRSEGYRPLSAGKVEEAVKLVESEPVIAVITDLKMPGGGGLDLLREVKKLRRDLPVIVLTGVGTIDDAVTAMKGGAYDFIQKPVNPDEFSLLLRRATEHQDLVREVSYLRAEVNALRSPSELIGESAGIREVRRLVAQVAPSDLTVLLTGESGTGKELVAAEIHRRSVRAEKNFVRVNCAAITETLFESEFFGHRRGSFTGAISDRVGRFGEAEGGSLALDEIGVLKPEMQAKLLRVLETGEYQVVGESRTRIADVRVIAITNEDLGARVREGAFRSDLFYRLNVFPIAVPPLRGRERDIVLLAEYFLKRARPALGQTAAQGPLFEPDAEAALLAYPWPGNVRELRNVMERASILAGDQAPDAALFARILGGADRTGDDDNDLNIRRRVDALERRLIAAALKRAAGRKRDAALLLGVDPKNLGYYLKKHGVAEPEEM
jgi:two-component system, NtrC family, response regulator PilR